MSDRIVLSTGIPSDVVLSTSPSVSSATVFLTGLFDLDGSEIGTNDSGTLLAVPVEMTEGGSGVYSTSVIVSEPGLYFAEFTVNGTEYGPVIVRVLGIGENEFVADSESVIGVVSGLSGPVQVTVTDREGTSAGADSEGEPVAWPRTAVPVPGHGRCHYIDDVTFDEGGKYHLAMRGSSGPTWTDSISVYQSAQGSATHFDGWVPDAAYSPSSWLTVGYIRRMTGWGTSVSDYSVRELRRMAIETFIERTNRWFPPWIGVWHSLRGQGERLYLPVPVLLMQDGASTDPVVALTQKFGGKSVVETIAASSLCWRTRGIHERQPYIEMLGRSWNPNYDVKVSGTFGSVGLSSQVPLSVKQCLVGLVRWHSLSYRQGPDEARDQATLNRISGESSRDRSVTYHESAISSGLTGDPTIDRALASFTINPGPWARNRGDL